MRDRSPERAAYNVLRCCVPPVCCHHLITRSADDVPRYSTVLASPHVFPQRAQLMLISSAVRTSKIKEKLLLLRCCVERQDLASDSLYRQTHRPILYLINHQR